MSNTQVNVGTPERRRGLGRTGTAIILISPAMLLYAVILAYPLLASLWVGLFERSLVRQGSRFVGLENVLTVLSEDFARLAWNTIVFSVGATILPFLLAFGLALLLNQGIRGQKALRGILLFPWILPGVVVSFLWLWIVNPNYGVMNGALRMLGLIDSNINVLTSPTLSMLLIIVAKSWQSFPWVMVMLLAGLQAVPKDLLEAISVDGGGAFRRLWTVTLPALRGIILTVLLLELLWNFQHFDMIWVLTRGGPAGATSTLSVELYSAAFQSFDLGRAGAIGIIWMALLAIPVYLVARFDRSNR
ncbi:carbohydrate ABC transporter permease [Ruania alba]|uniref:Carbohydrate ABC transporter membrane protein 1, CUT1 family n=1 Tax=Ruania alba TaxID=648782 RepID=A0A1H5MYI3_9MICO|nr:sugar ABC transporter permease [Ruania alba]SEE94240.1 carbohydrate ABC transporter membrane protein 1, CUT1 family [Ruania alba]